MRKQFVPASLLILPLVLMLLQNSAHADQRDSVRTTIASLKEHQRLDEALNATNQALADTKIHDVLKSKLLRDRGDILAAKGNLEESAKSYENVLDLQMAIYGPEHQMLDPTLRRLFEIRIKQQDWSQAYSLAQRLLQLRTHALPLTHKDCLETLADVALCEEKLRQPDKDVASYLENLCKGSSPPLKKIESMLVLQDLCLQAKAPSIARQVYGRNVSFTSELPLKTEVDALLVIRVANDGLWDHYYDQASILLMRLADGLSAPELTSLWPRRYWAARRLGECCTITKKPKQAAESFGLAIRLANRLPEPERNHELAVLYRKLGVAMLNSGDFLNAKVDLARALQLTRIGIGTDNPQFVQSLYCCASAELRLQNYQAAVAYYEQAVPICKKIYGNKSKETAIAEKYLAGSRQRLNMKHGLGAN